MLSTIIQRVLQLVKNVLSKMKSIMEGDGIINKIDGGGELATKGGHLLEIEKQTGQQVTIDANETDEALMKCHDQEQSPLFSVLPKEIRVLIWQFATAPYEDEQHAYETKEYYYRPGHTARLKTDYNLLLTCRSIWLEANRLPMLQSENCYWRYRAAPDARDKQWMANLTSLNRQSFGHLHLFAQMFAIEGLRSDAGSLRKYFLETTPKAGDFQPRMLHVTIRHTDW